MVESETASPQRRSKGRPRTSETGAIDAAIRAAAVDTLLREGPGVTMNAIVAASGLSRKTVYARYPNKDALMVEAVRDVLARPYSFRFEPAEALEDRLFNYLHAAMLETHTPTAITLRGLMMMQPQYLSALGEDIAGSLERTFLAPLRVMLARARDDGEIVADDVDRAASAIIRLVLAPINLRTHPALPVPAEMIVDHARFITRLALRGLAPR